ncbi:RNA-directed DNA polymerase, eukaryota [Tanacetum coccineum]
MGSILVNGSPTSKFQFHKGLKQGDPLSPFLFILVMESLHLSFQKVVNAGLFKGVVLDNSLQLSHLFYADDVVFVGQWSDSNLNTIVHVLECFFRASGLRINMHKSKIMGVVVENSKVTLAAANIGCMILKAPFNYLGVKIGGRMTRINSWDEIINKLLCRLSKWKMKTLSIGERLTLLKSVLSSMPIYYMSLFKVSLQEESWKDNIPFKSLYPRLYALESVKNVTVAENIALYDLCSSFRRMPRSGVEQQQLLELCSKVEGLSLPNMCDRWYWSLSGNGEFSIALVQNFIDDHILMVATSKTRWIKVVPKKINILAWRVKMNNLPTRFNLSHRGMDLDSILCPSCNAAAETTSHIFFGCHMAKGIYNYIASWWEINFLEFSSYEEWWAWLVCNTPKMGRSGIRIRGMLLQDQQHKIYIRTTQKSFRLIHWI